MAGSPYDSAGNYWPTGYSYDAENRLISAPITGGGTVSFDYDANGQRVKKSNDTLYWYGANGEVLEETNLSGTSIQGGVTRKISKGDWIIVPEGVPHQIPAVEGGGVTVMTLHLPR